MTADAHVLSADPVLSADKVERFRRFALGTVIVNLAVILWGAFVRASGSGAGCGAHWPLCNGEVIPRAPQLETAIELTHRVTSGLALVMVVVLLIWAFRLFPKGHSARSWASWSMIFMVLEAAIGAGVVLLRLVAEDASIARAYWMGLHLINTFLLVAALTGCALRAEPSPPPLSLRARRGPSLLVLAALLAVLFVGVSGALTALGDTLFPASSLAAGMAQDRAADSHFLVRLRVIHPILAIVVALCAGGAAAFAATLRARPSMRRAARWVGILLLVQIAGGFLNLVLLAPTWMQLVHLLLADLLWIALVVLAIEVASEPAPAPDPGSSKEERAPEEEPEASALVA